MKEGRKDTGCGWMGQYCLWVAIWAWRNSRDLLEAADHMSAFPLRKKRRMMTGCLLLLNLE